MAKRTRTPRSSLSNPMIPLPQMELCEACAGGCCLHIGMPPFEVRNPDLGPAAPWSGGRANLEARLVDSEIFDRMPAELRAEHAAKLAALTEDPTGTPCDWLDAETGKCRNYEYRPHDCRAWNSGREECGHLMKRWKATCVWRGDSSPWNWRNPHVWPVPEDNNGAGI